MPSLKIEKETRDIVDYGLEFIYVEIRLLKCRPFIMVAWYRPPSDPMSSFDLLEKVLSLLDRKGKEVILIGDTNCDFSDRVIDSDFNSIHLLNIYGLFFFQAAFSGANSGKSSEQNYY